MHSKQTVPQGMRESTPVERILDLHASASSVKQEFPGFSRGECQIADAVGTNVHCVETHIMRHRDLYPYRTNMRNRHRHGEVEKLG